MTDDNDIDIDRERMEERVDTLLSRAEDFRRHGEDGSADAAIALAAKIMMKHTIDAAAINAARLRNSRAEESIVRRTVEFTGIYRKALAMQFGRLIRANFPVRPIRDKLDNTEYLELIGYESDVEQLTLLITSLNLQAIGGMNKWWQGFPGRAYLIGMEGYKARRQFIASFIDGASDRIAVSRQSAIDEAAPGTAIVLRDRQSAVDDYVAANIPTVPLKSRMKAGTASAAIAGYDTGRIANVGEPTVTNDRRQITS